ncbi:MAG: hypothetical protein M1833_002690 [Piccolia ochrophora]|nr:MAG: hypothetical protein M1833_002690 [Piccolia ochrophora]
MAGKSPYHAPPRATYRQASASPPEAADSVTTGVPSFSNSTASSNYAGSASGDYDSSAAGPGVDLMELLNDRFTGAFDPVPLDRGLVTQAQTSGALNAKHRELLAKQTEAQRRLASSRAKFADGLTAAKEVKRDLDWTQKRVSSLKSKTEKKYSREYAMARDRYPAPVDY